MLPENRTPTHPGVILKREFLVPLGVSQVTLAAHLGVPLQRINEIVRGQLYLRAARIEAGTNKMRDVTIYDLSNRKNRRTILAETGDLAFSSTGEDLLLTLYDGHSTEVGADNPERLQRNFFTRDMIRVALAWGAGLTEGQRFALTPRAAGEREPTPADVQAILRAGGPGSGGPGPASSAAAAPGARRR